MWWIVGGIALCVVLAAVAVYAEHQREEKERKSQPQGGWSRDREDRREQTPE